MAIPADSLTDSYSQQVPREKEYYSNPSLEFTRDPNLAQSGKVVRYLITIDILEQDSLWDSDFGLFLPAAPTASSVFINGSLVDTTRPIINGEIPRLHAKPQVIEIRKDLLKSGHNIIEVRLSSLDFASAYEGFVYFGNLRSIKELSILRVAKAFAIASIQLFLFLYFIFIYSQRRADKFYLAFALLNISLSVWLISFKGYSLYLFDDRLSYIIPSFIIGSTPTIFLYEFLVYFLSIKRTKVAVIFECFFGICIATVLIELVFTRSIYYYYRYLFEIFINGIILFIFYTFFRIWKDYFKEQIEISYSLMIGLIVFFIAIIHDIGIFLNLIIAEPHLNDGFFFMSLAFSFALAKRYSDTYNALESTQTSLRLLNESLETKVVERTKTIAAQKEEIEQKTRILERDLAIAAKIQSALLPSDLPKIPNIRLAYRYEPMLDVGGDFVDSIVDRTGRAIGVFICDVTGHGTGAAMVASMVKMALQDWSDYLSDPGHMLTKMRAQLIGKLNGNFLTATIATFFPESGRLMIANAGHPETVILRKNFPRPELFRPSGMAINESMKTPYHTEITVLGPGDKLVLYTDGLPEAREPNGEFFGDENFFQLLSGCADQEPDSFCSSVIEHIREFTKEQHNSHDDMALLVLEYLGKPEARSFPFS